MANTVMMPRIGLNETENMLGEFYVKEGDKITEGDELFSVETDKSSLSVYAETSGTVIKVFYEAFDAVEVLTPVCVIGEPGEDISEIENIVGKGRSTADQSDLPVGEGPSGAGRASHAPEEAVAAPDTIDDNVAGGIIRISPRARRLAESNGIDYSRIIPGGAEGRIIESDIIAAISGTASCREQPAGKTVKFTKIRRIIADNMMNSLHNTAQLTHHCYFDAGRVLELKEQYKADNKKVTIGDLVTFGLSRTLKEFPEINAHLVNDDEIIVYQSVNLGMAVDTPRGLMVPTIRGADQLTLDQLSAEAGTLAEECRGGAINPDKLKGATFTVSNVGSFGIQYFTPIINPPQIGILGVGTIDYRIRKTSNGMEFYPAGYLSLTYDHRAIDGAPASRFLRALCGNLENIHDLII